MSHGIEGYGSKTEILVRMVAGHSVLHLGCVGETYNTLEAKVAAAPSSLHAVLTEAASECVGVDYDEQAVAELSPVFGNLIAADVTTLRRQDVALEKIDFVVAGDVIEHLSNPGLMLDALGRLADPGTRLLVTVPNSLGVPQFIRYMEGKRIEGFDHKASYNVYTMTHLLADHGWKVRSVCGCHQATATAHNGRLALWVGTWFFHKFPSISGTLLFEAAMH